PAYPLLGEVVRHDPGRELTLRRRLDLAEDRFAGDHTIGGITASKVDPTQRGLPVMPMTFSLEIMAETAATLVPGKVVVGFRRARLRRWPPFAARDPSSGEVTGRVVPAQTTAETLVALEIRDLGNAASAVDGKRVAVQGTAVLADCYPEPPPARPFPLTN